MSDIVVNTAVVQNGMVIQKPSYLLALSSKDGKGKDTKEFFLLTDKPDTDVAFVSCKGFYVSGTEEEISANLSNLLTQTDKKEHANIMFPWTRILYIKNLTYKAK